MRRRTRSQPEVDRDDADVVHPFDCHVLARRYRSRPIAADQVSAFSDPPLPIGVSRSARQLQMRSAAMPHSTLHLARIATAVRFRDCGAGPALAPGHRCASRNNRQANLTTGLEELRQSDPGVMMFCARRQPALPIDVFRRSETRNVRSASFQPTGTLPSKIRRSRSARDAATPSCDIAASSNIGRRVRMFSQGTHARQLQLPGHHPVTSVH